PARVLLPPGGPGSGRTSPSPLAGGAVRRSRRTARAPPGARGPASTVPSSASTSPPAWTATGGPTSAAPPSPRAAPPALTAPGAPPVPGPASTSDQPRPPLVIRSGPATLP